MTRGLARLADLAYRRRGRMVLAWIAATVVIIGVGSSLAGEYNADYDTPGLGVEGRERPHRGALRRLLGPGDLRRLEGPRRRQEPRGAASASTSSSPRPSRSTTSPSTTPIRVSRGRQDRRHHAAADGPRLGGREGGRRGADRRRRGQQRRRARDQARRRSDLRGAGGASPEGLGFLGAAIVLLIAFGSVVAAGLPLADRAGRPRHHLRRPDRCCSPTSSTCPTGRRRSRA